ncbi:hypothetical protein DFJ43DRAFT_1034217, partial [Lentinula guzmanii]
MTTRKRYALCTTETSINGLRQQLKADFQKRIYSDVAVKEFVHTVFDLSNEEIDEILEFKFRPDLTAIVEYRRGIETGKLEKQLYTPFVKVAHDLLDSYLAEKFPGKDRSIRLYEDHGDARLSQTHTNSHTRRSPPVGPDVLSLWTSSDDPNDFAAIQLPFEFKREKRRRLASVEEEDPFIDRPFSDSGIVARKNSNPKSSSSRRLTKSVQNPVGRRLQMKKIKKLPRKMPAIPEVPRPPETEDSGPKRKRSPEDIGGRDTFNKDEAQLASYSVKCFESSSRFFVAGIYVQHWTMILWYYDRMGAARTVSFQFSVEDAQTLGLVLVALNHSDASRSGYSSFLHASDHQDPGNSLCSTTNQRFPTAPSNPLSELLLVSNKLPPKGRKGSVLRFPCSVVDDEGNEMTAFRAFVIEAILFSYPGLIGRGTEAYLVYELLVSKPQILQQLVAKLAWCSVHRPPESKTIRKLLENAPEISRHLPDVVFACVYDSNKHLRLPRYKMLSCNEWVDQKISGVDFEKRDLVVIVMKRYRPLWSAKNLEEFKKVFVDLVECHHRAYKNGGYLHRDISETNLMIDRDGDDAVVGVLCDWDLSSAVDDDGVVVTSSNATHRTGTYPFLATDLLAEKPPVHLYRHDLESFFYILIWAGLHYSFDGEAAKYHVHDEVKVWMDAGRHIDARKDKKSLILGARENAKHVFDHFHPDFKPLVKQWVRPLWKLFRCAFKKADRCENPDDFDSSADSDSSRGSHASFDNITLGGTLTFENFMN